MSKKNNRAMKINFKLVAEDIEVMIEIMKTKVKIKRPILKAAFTHKDYDLELTCYKRPAKHTILRNSSGDKYKYLKIIKGKVVKSDSWEDL